MKKIFKFPVIVGICIFVTIILIFIFFIVDLHNNSNVSYSFTNADIGIIEAYDLFVETNAQLQINFDSDTKDDALCYLLLDLDNKGSIEIKDENAESLIIDDNNMSENLYVIIFNPTNQNEKYKNCIQFSEGAYHRIVTTGTGKEIKNMNPFEYCFEQNKNGYIINTLSFYEDYCVYILNSTDQETDFILNDFIICKFTFNDKKQKKGVIEEVYEFNAVKRTITLKPYYKLFYVLDSFVKFKDGEEIKNDVPIQILFKDKKEDISNIEMFSIESFKTSLSSGSLSYYPTATEVLYPINCQDVALFPANNKVTGESRVNIKKSIMDDDTVNVTGIISIPKGSGTIADKQISLTFKEWLYGNYNIILLELLTILLSCYITHFTDKIGSKNKNKNKKKGKK